MALSFASVFGVMNEVYPNNPEEILRQHKTWSSQAISSSTPAKKKQADNSEDMSGVSHLDLTDDECADEFGDEFGDEFTCLW